ncbi:MAG: hypothetical protein WCD31_13190 [Gillisia sp.]
MTYLAAGFSGRTMMLLGALATIAFCVVVLWIVFKLVKHYKKKA